MNGKNIKKYRDDNGISQIELAKQLGVARSTLARWEKNKTFPRDDDYDHLKDIIGDEYLTDVDLTVKKDAIEAIGDVSDRVDNILYQVSQIEYNQRSFEEENNRSKLKHRRIRTAVVIITCIIILAIFLYTWFVLVNHGIKDKVIEGSDEMGTPSYFEIDDGK